MGASSYCFEKFDRILLLTNFLNNLIMKKKNLNSLNLNKKSISNFSSVNIAGGKHASDCTSQLTCFETICITDYLTITFPTSL